MGNLLKVYPEFDETPLVRMPDKYVWPNIDKLKVTNYMVQIVMNQIFITTIRITDYQTHIFQPFSRAIRESFLSGVMQTGCPTTSNAGRSETESA